MSEYLTGEFGNVKRWIKSAYNNLSYRITVPWNRGFIRDFWDGKASMIHEEYGNLAHDYQILSSLITAYNPSSVLDVGCGSGRLFEVYARCKIQDVVGIDISKRALSLAYQRFPNVSTLCGSPQELDFPSGRFDMAVCNRVLQHIPSLAIAEAVAKLCQWCQFIYINELTNSDKLDENFYMIRHDYAALFSREGFQLLEDGFLGDQTYQVYSRR